MSNRAGSLMHFVRGFIYKIVIALAVILPLKLEAAIISTPTCSSTDLQTAVNNAQSGDTIQVPAGTCTWKSPVLVEDKSVRIVGAGIDQSNITVDIPNVSPVQVTPRLTDTFFMSGFTWRLQSAGSGSGFITIGIRYANGYPPVAFRISQMKMYGDPMDGVSYGGRFITANGVYGVVDHVTMIDQTARGAGNISMSPDSSASATNNYHIPITLGDQNALYIEDCDFQFVVANQGNGAVDHYTGARYVFRHNTVRNNNVGNHGWDSQHRGTRSFEIYQNTFIADSMIGQMEVFGPRSGSGTFWGNTVKNIQPQNGTGYLYFFAPRYYGGMSPYATGGDVSLNARAPGYYPTMPWGQLPYPGTSGPIFDGTGNYVTGSNPIDGNQIPPGHMDPAYTRTVNDLVTTSGSKTITSATINFTQDDLTKMVIAANIKPGRIVQDGHWTNGSNIVTSATANFTAGDVGRNIGTEDRSTIPENTYIASITNSTTAVMTKAAIATGTGQLHMVDSYFASIVNSTTAILTTPAEASGTGGRLTLGYTDQGYPLADQPGRGSFPSANPGNWPNVTTGYSDANYEALDPIYLYGNHWQTVNNSMSILTDTNPPASIVGLAGNQAYIKRLREYYDDPDTGMGTLANRPTTCTTGYGYWATDQGGNWDKTNSSANDGALYRCISTNTWALYYTPYTYPHPLVSGDNGITPSAPANLKIVPGS